MERFGSMEDSSPYSSGWGRISGRVTSRFQHLLDKLTPLATVRWGIFAGVVLCYAVRVYFLKGFYIVTYGLGIYLLNRLIGFLSPMVDPELEGPSLPTSADEEFKPFQRRLPEFKFWYSCTKAFVTAFCMTFFSFFDVPVFWPILLMYWMVLFFITMKRQIRHMIKHRYLPFSRGKQVYKNKPVPLKSGESASDSSRSK
mmetsp:Transcript_11962/g.16219  ORF Transcript_11962/g.16219 Transcript_11962/m.16219 type:complete len:199 (-) Transcript_11962:255-851(-)